MKYLHYFPVAHKCLAAVSLHCFYAKSKLSGNAGILLVFVHTEPVRKSQPKIDTDSTDFLKMVFIGAEFRLVLDFLIKLRGDANEFVNTVGNIIISVIVKFAEHGADLFRIESGHRYKKSRRPFPAVAKKIV